MNAKTNSMPFGVFLGIVLPLIAFSIFFLYNMDKFPTVNEFTYFLSGSKIFAALVSLCVVPNLIIFFVFIRNNALKSARGVILSTFLFALVVVYLKVFA